MNMKVERVGIDKIKDKFNSLKKQISKPIQSFVDFEKKYND